MVSNSEERLQLAFKLHVTIYIEYEYFPLMSSALIWQGSNVILMLEGYTLTLHWAEEVDESWLIFCPSQDSTKFHTWWLPFATKIGLDRKVTFTPSSVVLSVLELKTFYKHIVCFSKSNSKGNVCCLDLLWPEFESHTNAYA